MPAPAHRHRGALPHLRQSIQRCGNLLSRPTSVQDTQCGLTIRSTGPIAAVRHLGYKSLAQMPAHRNGPVSSNVRPHLNPAFNRLAVLLQLSSHPSIQISSISLKVQILSCSPPDHVERHRPITQTIRGVWPNPAFNRTHCGVPAFGLLKPSPNTSPPQRSG